MNIKHLVEFAWGNVKDFVKYPVQKIQQVRN